MIPALLGLPGRMKMLLDRVTNSTNALSDARVAKLDKLNATVSSRLASSAAVSNTVYTDAKAGYIDADITSRLASIKRIWTETIYVVLNGAVAGATQQAAYYQFAEAKTFCLFSGIANYNTAGSSAPIQVAVGIVEAAWPPEIWAYVNSADLSTQTVTFSVCALCVEFN